MSLSYKDLRRFRAPGAGDPRCTAGQRRTILAVEPRQSESYTYPQDQV